MVRFGNVNKYIFGILAKLYHEVLGFQTLDFFRLAVRKPPLTHAPMLPIRQKIYFTSGSAGKLSGCRHVRDSIKFPDNTNFGFS